MAESSTNEDAGERLGAMVVEWAETYWQEQGQASRGQGGASGSEFREAVTKAFVAGALTVFERWDEVRPLVPRRRIPWRDLPSHHG